MVLQLHPLWEMIIFVRLETEVMNGLWIRILYGTSVGWRRLRHMQYLQYGSMGVIIVLPQCLEEVQTWAGGWRRYPLLNTGVYQVLHHSPSAQAAWEHVTPSRLELEGNGCDLVFYPFSNSRSDPERLNVNGDITTPISFYRGHTYFYTQLWWS
jgi:hypothetical protein